MKNKFSILIVLFLTLLVGCKDDKSTDTATQKSTEEKAVNLIKVTLTAVVGKDDKFQLFYKEDDNVQVPFAEQDAIWKDVKGSADPQKIEFLLPEGVFPNYLRLDVGTNSENQNINISGMKIEYMEKSIDMGSTQFLEGFFINNAYIVVQDKASGLIKTKKDENGFYDPFFNSGENLKGELQKLYK